MFGQLFSCILDLIVLGLLGLQITRVIVNSSWKPHYIMSKYTYGQFLIGTVVATFVVWLIYYFVYRCIYIASFSFQISYVWLGVKLLMLIFMTILVFCYRKYKLDNLNNFNYAELMLFIIISMVYVYLFTSYTSAILRICSDIMNSIVYYYIICIMWAILKIVVCIVLASTFLNDSYKFKRSLPIIQWQVFIIVMLIYVLYGNILMIVNISTFDWFRLNKVFDLSEAHEAFVIRHYMNDTLVIIFLVTLQLTYLIGKEKSLLYSCVRVLIAGIVSLLIIGVMLYMFLPKPVVHALF